MDLLWEHTQDPALHERWDVRFSTIEHLPRTADMQLQRIVSPPDPAGLQSHHLNVSVAALAFVDLLVQGDAPRAADLPPPPPPGDA